MSRTSRILFTGSAAMLLAACADLTSSRFSNALTVESAFQTVPVGFSANSNSFDPSGDPGLPFFPGEISVMPPMSSHRDSGGPPDGERKDDRRGEGDHRDGFGGPGLRGLLMGGGLGPDFLGFVPFGKGRGRGPFHAFNLPDSCTYDPVSERVVCPDKIRDGLAVRASFQFKDAAGVVQQEYDTSLTDYVNARIGVSGTRTRKDSSTSTVDHRSDRTVTGLADGSTERTMNGTASGSETTTGTRDSVPFTAVRLATDTTRGLVIELRDGRPTIPSAGVVIRTMSVTITPEGGTAKSRFRREVIEFDGTNVVKITITTNAGTKNCTITLPGKKLVCEDE